MSATEAIRTYCRLCEVGCGLVATVEGGVLTRVRADHDHPTTRGFACSNGLRAAEVHRDPHRLRTPQKRVGDRFVSVSWDDALGEIAIRLNELIERIGPRAVGMYLGNPNAFNMVGSAAAGMFVRGLGSDRMFSAVTQDCSNKYAVAELVYGTQAANPIPDIERTELLLVIGSNPRVSKSSFMSVADPVAVLRGVRERGGRVVFVNPLRIEPDIGETVCIRPDSDPYFLAALLHEVHRTTGFRLGALDGRVEGVDEVAAFIAPYSPAAVAEVVGVPAETIAALARDFVAANGASIHVSTGLNMGRQGALAYWLVQMLLVLTGNLDRPGGSFFAARATSATPPPVDRSASSFEQSPWGEYRRAVGMVPAALIPEFVDHPDEPMRALFVMAGNPVLTMGGEARMRHALSSLDLLVSVDLYRNATGELADFVLPATDQFEREDLNTFVQGVQVEPYAQWTPRVVPPNGDQREEWRIFGGLSQAMGRPALLDPETTTDPLPMLFDGALASSGLSIGALRDAGGVIVLDEPGPGGSLERLGVNQPIPCVPDALRSTLQRGHTLFDELRHEPADQFKMITRRMLGMINSTLGNVPARNDDGAVNPLWMNPDDALRLGLVDGDLVEISNEHGAIEAEVRGDDRLRTGVVAMTHGYGNAATAGMPNAQARPGVNVNVLAPIGPGTFDPVSCMSQVTGIAVAVRPVR